MNLLSEREKADIRETEFKTEIDRFLPKGINNTEYRCKFCHKLLGKGEIQEGQLEIKCSKCGKFNLVKLERTTEDVISSLT